MAVYLVTYDLNKAGKNYDGLIDAIKAYGAWCKSQKSAWFIDTPKTAAEIRDDLQKHIDADDDLYVVELVKHWASSGTFRCGAWLKKDTRSWHRC
jgi:hypothetical protein